MSGRATLRQKREATHQEGASPRPAGSFKTTEEGDAAYADGQCFNPHFKGDGTPTDYPSCWDPPKAWCSGPFAALVMGACAPDGSVCCSFGDGCIPCDWEYCPPAEGEDEDPDLGCPIAIDPDAPECQVDMNVTVCI